MSTMYLAKQAREAAKSKKEVDFMTSIVDDIKEVAERYGGFSLTRYVAGWDNALTAKKILKSWGYCVSAKKDKADFRCTGPDDILGAELTISWKE